MTRGNEFVEVLGNSVLNKERTSALFWAKHCAQETVYWKLLCSKTQRNKN